MAKLNGIAQTTEAVEQHIKAARNHIGGASPSTSDSESSVADEEESSKSMKLESPSQETESESGVGKVTTSEGNQEEENSEARVGYTSPAPSNASSDPSAAERECACYRCYCLGFAAPRSPPFNEGWCGRESTRFKMNKSHMAVWDDLLSRRKAKSRYHRISNPNALGVSIHYMNPLEV